MRRSALCAAAALLAALTAGCTAEACPAIGWSNSLPVHLTGDTPLVAEVEVYFDGVCSDPEPQPRQGSRTLVPDGRLPPSPPSSAPVEYSPFFATRVDTSTWRIQLSMASPDRVSVRALAADGTVLAEENVAVEWKRVGGSARCGGPMKAAPVELDL